MVYSIGDQIDDHATQAESLMGNAKTEVDRILDLLASLKSSQCGLLATAYTAWKDLLTKGESPNDREILRECRHRWHDSKKGIADKSWFWALRVLRANGLTPKEKSI